MKKEALTHSGKSLVLGTALWGWGVDQATAFQIADIFRARGGLLIDTATNYPINRNLVDFGIASTWVAEWLRLNPDSGVHVLAKIGSIDNSGGPSTLLGSSFIDLSVSFLEAKFQEALSIVAVHWDNREDAAAIVETLDRFRAIRQCGYGVGFSGVSRPDLYRAAAPDLADQWVIQVKENLQTNEARARFSSHFPNARYLAYGINMGGLKLDGQFGANSSMALRSIDTPAEARSRAAALFDVHRSLSFAPASMNELALLNAFFTPNISGVIMGPRNALQAKQSMAYWDRLGLPENREEWNALQSELKSSERHA